MQSEIYDSSNQNATISHEPLVYGSVCSGIEAATVAWEPLGWKPAFFSEIDAFPRAVLAHHYPNVPCHGDFTTIKEDQYAAIDVLVGGTPCQAFSVAGLRKGFADERGNLTLEYVRLAQRLRPRWLVWENVPGVLSIDGGRAFGSFLAGLAECGYGFAYRVLDAQHFGVPQRRRRVFVVGYLGDWRPAAAVLFERESLCRNLTPSRKTGKSVAALTANGVGTCGADDNQGQAGHLIASSVSSTLQAGGRLDFESETFIAHSLRAEGFDASEDGTGRGTPLVPVPFDTTQITSKANRSCPKAGDPCHPLASSAHAPAIAFSCKDHGADAGDTSPTLRAMGHSGSHANAGGQVAVAIPINTQLGLRGDTSNTSREGVGIGSAGDPAFTLQSAHGHAVAIGWNGDATTKAMTETMPCMKADQGGEGYGVATGMAVRRLTPRECERLQEFPDDFTLVPYRVASNRKFDSDFLKYLLRGNPKHLKREDIDRLAMDGPRYKALGNSMAVPVMAWIGRRIQAIEDLIVP